MPAQPESQNPQVKFGEKKLLATEAQKDETKVRARCGRPSALNKSHRRLPTNESVDLRDGAPTRVWRHPSTIRSGRRHLILAPGPQYAVNARGGGYNGGP